MKSSGGFKSVGSKGSFKIKRCVQMVLRFVVMAPTWGPPCWSILVVDMCSSGVPFLFLYLFDTCAPSLSSANAGSMVMMF